MLQTRLHLFQSGVVHPMKPMLGQAGVLGDLSLYILFFVGRKMSGKRHVGSVQSSICHRDKK